MVGFPLAFGMALVSVWVIIWIHEYGHYYAGRNIVGVPDEAIRVVDPYFPRYVALNDGEEWVSPADLDRYRSVYDQYDPAGDHVERFHAAGELIQAAVVVPVAVVVGLAVTVEFGVALLALSLLSTVVYVLVDLLGTLYTGSASGDYSVLWGTAPSAPALLLLGFSSVHVVPLLVLT